MDFTDKPLGTPGKRLHAFVLLAGLAYAALHLLVGTWLLDGQTPITRLLIALTVAVALGNVVLVAPTWVISAWSLVRGPRALVSLPDPVPDARLPLLIVQVPGRNEPFELVCRSIASVLAADYPSDRLRVQFVDNSDDDRWQRVAAHYAQDPRVRVEHRDGTAGFKGGNLNIGLDRLGRCDRPDQVLIGLLDVGDTFAPRALRPMATEFVHEPRMGFVQGMFRSGNPHQTVISWTDGLVGDAARRFTEGYLAHYGVPTMNGHCALLRLAALDDVGRWNESRVAEDWTTGMGMLTRGWKGKWVDYDPTDPLMISTELVPGELTGQQKQKRRWATGGAELTRHHLLGWLRAELPWHQRLSIILRLGATLSVLPSFALQLLFPFWLAAAMLGQASPGVLYFGLASAFLQNPFHLANAAAAFNYAREGALGRAALLVLVYPIQSLWHRPIFVHAGVGVAEGLGRKLNAFVVTPKTAERASVWEMLRAQQLVLALALWGALPALVVALVAPERLDQWLALALTLPVVTVLALFLVPLTQWAFGRHREQEPHYSGREV